jgi:hypothetical protein
MLVKAFAVDRNDQAIDRALSFVCLHGFTPTRFHA